MNRPLCFVSSIVLVVCLDVPAEPVPAVPVLVYDYTSLSAAALDRTLAEAGAIFARAGVRLVPSRCPAKTIAEVSCADGRDVPGLRVRLFDGVRASPGSPHANTSGYAAFDPEGGARLATLFYGPVEKLAWRVHMPPERVLGRVMAHELAHLLLGPGAHTENGLMCTRWGSAEAVATRPGFTKDEEARLREAASRLSPGGGR